MLSRGAASGEDNVLLRRNGDHNRDAHIEFFEDSLPDRINKVLLEKGVIKPTDKPLSHKYVYYPDPQDKSVFGLIPISVTGFVESAFPHKTFQDYRNAIGRKKWDTSYSVVNPDGTKRRMTDSELQLLWKEKGEKAQVLGTDLHGFMERVALARASGDPDRIRSAEYFSPDSEGAAEKRAGLQWLDKIATAGVEPFLTEYVMYTNEKVMSSTGVMVPALAGSLDLIIAKRIDSVGEMKRDDQNTSTRKRTRISLRDYKRCDTSSPWFSKGFRGEKCLAPFEDMDSCKRSHWVLQMNVYRQILEDQGFDVVDMAMIAIFDGKVEEHIIEKVDVSKKFTQLSQLRKPKISNKRTLEATSTVVPCSVPRRQKLGGSFSKIKNLDSFFK